MKNHTRQHMNLPQVHQNIVTGRKVEVTDLSLEVKQNALYEQFGR